MLQGKGENAGYQPGENAGYQQEENSGYQQGENAGYQQLENTGYQHFLLFPAMFSFLLSLSKTTNFRLFQTGRSCRQQF